MGWRSSGWGDRGASNGHDAELVSLPTNLVAKVSDGQAAFTSIGVIGLKRIRLLYLRAGETTVVFGLGLVGLVALRLVRADSRAVVEEDMERQF